MGDNRRLRRGRAVVRLESTVRRGRRRRLGVTAVMALLGAAAGAGIGAGVDAAVKGPTLIVYAAPGARGGSRLLVAPLVTPRAKGVAVSFAF